MNQNQQFFERISDFIKALLIISLISTVILFLLEHPIKYALYIFAVLISGIMLLTVFRTKINFDFNLKKLIKFSDYFLILSTVFVFVSNVFSVLEPTINFVLTLIVSFIVPGWVLLKILGINFEKEFNFGLMAIIFTVSAGLTSIIFLSMLPFKEDASTFLASVYLTISIIPLLKEKFLNFNKQKKSSIKTSIQRQFNGLELLFIGSLTIFFVFVISILYPQMSFFPTDITRHYSEATGLLLSTDIYGSNYPWHHFVLSSIHELSKPPMWLFQSGIAFMGIMLPLSFYIMSKMYLSEINQRAHIFATIFFFIFSGFGWIFLISQKFFIPESGSYFDMLVFSNNVSYWDIGAGQGSWLWFWFRPLTIGFSIFFVLIYLLKKHSFSRIQYLVITSILMVTLIQIHLPEFLIFVFLLLIVSIVKPKIKLRLKETAFCVIISLAFLILVTSYQSLFTSSYHPLSLERTIALIGISGIILLFIKFPLRPNLSIKINWKVVTLISLFIYFIFLMYWFYSSDEFSVGTVREILGVPLEFYPPLLGIVGIMAIPGIFITLKKYGNNPVIIFVILFISVIIIGRLLTFINAESLFITGYFERRLIPFVYVAASILAALLVTKFLEKINITWNLNYTKKIALACIFSLLVVGGISSTFLTIEYSLLKMQNNPLSENELKFYSLLEGIDPYSFFITITDTSRSYAQFYNLCSNCYHYREQIWTSTNPETTLNAFSSLNSSSVILLAERDLKNIKKYEDGYVSSHLLKVGPRIESQGGLFVEIPPLSSPSSKSDLVLVIPDDQKKYFYAYDILSLGQFNYTTALLSDVSTWKKSKTLIIPSENLIHEIIDYKEKFNVSFKKLVVLNLDGFNNFLPLNSSLKNSLLIDNDYASSNWIPYNLENEKSAPPQILDTIDINDYEENLLVISVEESSIKNWKISKQFDSQNNFSEFDVAKFDWLGRGDQQWYEIKFVSVNDGFFWYKFNDSHEGWTEITLPLRMNDGREIIYGNQIQKITKNNATWNEISRIDFGPSPTNSNYSAGTFFIDSFAFDEILKSDAIEDIWGNKIDLPFHLQINQFPKSFPHLNITAHYTPDIPFAINYLMTKKLDHQYSVETKSNVTNHNSFNLIYLNVYPIIQELDSGKINSTQLYSVLGNLLNFAGNDFPSIDPITRSKYAFVKGGIIAFNEGKFDGFLELQSTSSIFYLNSSLINGKIDNSEFEFDSISKIIPIDTDQVRIKSNEGKIKNGIGYYTKLILNSSYVNFDGHPTTLLLEKNNGNQIIISGNQIEINLNNSTILMREPKINSNGTTKFENFYSFGTPFNNLQILDKDITIVGNIEFTSKFSDKFIIATKSSVDGDIIQSNNKYEYDELKHLSNIFSLSFLPYLSILFGVFAGVSIIVFKNGIILKRIYRTYFFQ